MHPTGSAAIGQIDRSSLSWFYPLQNVQRRSDMSYLAGFERETALLLLASGKARRRYAFKAFLVGGLGGAIIGFCIAAGIALHYETFLTASGWKQIVVITLVGMILMALCSLAASIEAVEKLLKTKKNAEDYHRFMN